MPKTTTALAAERPRTSADIAAEISDLTATKAAAEAEVGRLAATRPGLLLDMSDQGDHALQAHDLAAGKASRTVERAGAVLAKLQSDLAAARHAERQAELRDVYAAGEKAAAEYRRLVEREYVPAAQKIAVALAGMQAALDIVAEANKALPEGVKAIDADAWRNPAYDRGTPPPREIEALVWIDSEGNVCRPALMSRGGKLVPDIAGAKQVSRMVPNPALATWAPASRRYAHDLLRSVKLPAVEVDVPAFWSGVAK